MSVATTVDGDTVLLELPGRRGELHALALRDACPCGACRLPSGQRRFESHLVLPGLGVDSIVHQDDGVVIRFTDGHEALFGFPLLEAELDAAAVGHRPRREVVLWGAEQAGKLPWAGYDELRSSDDRLREWLTAVAELGFALLRGVPGREGAVAEVAELFSPVRVTNYGRVFDVRVKIDATNLADSSLGLSLHTDNPYRFPQPTLQLLHCLASSPNGGQTVLSDGFRAVEELRRDDPASLGLLASCPIRFQYADADADLVADVPLVTLDVDDAPLSLQVNNRSKGTPAGPPDLVERWYRAYFRLHELLDAPEARVVFQLGPGDVVVFDNGRVLHGRTAFTDVGSRFLQGCYADRDALLSRLAVLERKGRGAHD